MDRIGALPDQATRPSFLRGKLNFLGQQYDFGSGGGRYQSIPFGTFPITPNAIGPWGQAHGAIGVNGNSIPDAKLGRNREGIELHASTNPDLITQGCIAIAGNQWPQFREQVMKRIQNGEKLFLHVGPDGAGISNTSGSFGAQAPAAPRLPDGFNFVRTQAVSDPSAAPYQPGSFGDSVPQPPGLLNSPYPAS